MEGFYPVKPKFVHPDDFNPTAKILRKQEFSLGARRRVYVATVGEDFYLRASDGRHIRPKRRRWRHNMGTVPMLFQAAIPALQKDRLPKSYAWHDELVESLTIQVLSADGFTWMDETITRWEADRLLCREFAVAEESWWTTRMLLIYPGVTLGTVFSKVRKVLDRSSKRRVRP